jgi:hypothetical protein
MNTIQILPEKKQMVISAYSELCSDLNILLDRLKAHIPNANENTIIDLLQYAGKHEHKAVAFLNTQFAAPKLPDGINVNKAIENGLVNLPDWKPVLFAWGNCMVRIEQSRMSHYSKGTNLHFPVIQLFDENEGKFMLTAAFLQELEQFFVMNIENPQNMVLISQFIDILNKFSEAGAWGQLHTKEQLHQLMDLVVVENGKFKQSSSALTSGIGSEILKVKRNKPKYTPENYFLR